MKLSRASNVNEDKVMLMIIITSFMKYLNK